MNVQEYLQATKTTTHRLSLLARVSYMHLREHVKTGRPLGLDVAKRLEKGTGGLIRAAHVLGLDGGETAEAVDLRSQSARGTPKSAA